MGVDAAFLSYCDLRERRGDAFSGVRRWFRFYRLSKWRRLLQIKRLNPSERHPHLEVRL